jgi:hypothetical protein
MAEPVQGSSAEQLIGEGIVPFTEVEVAGNHGGDTLVTFGDEVMEVFIIGMTQRLEPEVIDDQQRYRDQILELTLRDVAKAADARRSSTGAQSIPCR